MASIMRIHRRLIGWLLFMFLIAAAVGPTRAIAADAAYARELGKVKPKQLTEISGLAASRLNKDVLWVHNDGESRLLFAVSTSGKPVALVSWRVEIEDFEDLAIGPGPKAGADYLYIGDIGDNNSVRREVRIVRFEEPKLSELPNGQADVEVAEEFRLTYPDGAHNAEALIVDPISRDLFIVTKEKQYARLYTCPADSLKDNANANLEFVGTLGISEVSGGTIARDGSRIILRREEQGWLWNRESGQSVASALKRPPQRIPVKGSRQGRNGEAVAFSPDGQSYYTVSEGKNQIICEFELAAPAGAPNR